MRREITVYDRDMQKVAYLENATTVGYEQPMNGLWTAQFTLPADDPKNEECKSMYFVELFDERERLDLFRIMPTTAVRSTDGKTITYECEHVLATLLDDVLFQFHTVGNIGYYTENVIQYILSKQNVQRWQVGNIEFARQFEYNWENENLLGALFSVPRPFVEEFMWTWDTTTYPWTLNLVEPPNDEVAYIRYGFNMRGIERQVDPRGMVTRLYGLGYGEGVNQLNFADINGGVPYIDADTQDKYGIITSIFVDRRFESAETLKARCEAILNEVKEPYISYTIEAGEVHTVTGSPDHKFKSGSKARIIDEELGIDVTVRVVNKRKQDVYGEPGGVELEIANKPFDIANSIADLQNRMRIGEVYAQGATNLNAHDFADNCDPDHPAVMRFFIPEETARINKVMLSYQVEAFRSYSRAIQGGGGIATSTASGGGAVESTSSGGGTTVTSQGGGAIQTSTPAGGGATSGPSSTETTAAGGGTVSTETGDEVWRLSGNPTPPGVVIGWEDSHDHGGAAQSHNHGNPNNVNIAPAITGDGGHSHSLLPHYHRFDLENHVHEMDHTHQTPNHTHEVVLPDHTHQVTVPSHTHSVNIPAHTHDITLPDHSHEIEHGIFSGPTPTQVTVKVDGIVVPGLGTSVTEVDIIPYLSKDGGGKIQRGTWHTIEITPNTLGRIVANVISQIFVQSRGGGDY